MVSQSVFLYVSNIYCSKLAVCKDYYYNIKKSKGNISYIFRCGYFPQHLCFLYCELSSCSQHCCIKTLNDLQQSTELPEGKYVMDTGTDGIKTTFAALVYNIVRGNFS